MIKVIIIEDEENILKSLQYVINWKKCGCVLSGTAWNGKEGLDLIEKIKPDIVITDIRMPFIDGLEMIETALKFADFESIIISGYGSFEYAKTAIHLNVNEYILKPIDYQEVEDALMRLANKIKQKRMYQENLEPVYFSHKVKEVLEYIDEHIEDKITLSLLCEEFDTSSTTLNNLFKQEVNTTVNDYINQRKVHKSIHLLKSGKYLVYEVAEKLGFRDYKYFSRVFKKYTNKSPSDFLK